MRNHPSYSKRSRWPTLLLGGLVAALLGGGGLLLTLALLGVELSPFRKAPVEDPFVVRIPINYQPIPAYTRVDRTHLMHPRTGRLSYQSLPPESVIGMSISGVDRTRTPVESRVVAIKRDGDEVVFVTADEREVPQSQTRELGGALMNVNLVMGRVVRRDKRAGLGFQESSFFPQGTPEGLAGATPEGMRAMTLDASRLVGVHALNAGDRIDLLASLASEDAAAVSLSAGISSGSSGRGGNSVETVMLAEDAVVLKPVYVRTEAATSASLTQGAQLQSVPKYEVAIAVKPEDIVPVQSALNRSLPITCVAHSMQPAAAADTASTPAREDWVTVPVTVKPIEAYGVITRDAFISPATRKLRTESLPRAQLERMGVITSLDEMIGAIARQDIPAGCYLRRSDLLSGPPGSLTSPSVDPDQDLDTARRRDPSERWVTTHPPAAQDSGDASPAPTTLVQAPAAGQATSGATSVGDRPAITRFLPAGRVALAIPWNRVYGAEHLQIGDRIDLLASFSLSRSRSVDEQETRPDGTVIVRRTDALEPSSTDRSLNESIGFRAEPWFVATDAIVIAPVGFPPPAAALRALGNQAERPSSSGSQPSGPPILIAVEEADVETLASALVLDDAIFTVMIREGEVPNKLPSDAKRIVIASEPLLAFQPFSEQGWKGNRRQPATRVVPKSDPRYADAIRLEEVGDYYGRTLAVAKQRGDFLSSADFLPAGTAFGVAASARTGHTVWVVADGDVRGLDAFENEDRIAIVARGILGNGVDESSSEQQPTLGAASVIAPRVRIVRRSQAGQTVLEVPNDDLTALQAAVVKATTPDARSLQLLAVGLPRPGSSPEGDEWDSVAPPEIVAYGPRGRRQAGRTDFETMEVIIGTSRTTYEFPVPVAGGTER